MDIPRTLVSENGSDAVSNDKLGTDTTAVVSGRLEDVLDDSGGVKAEETGIPPAVHTLPTKGVLCTAWKPSPLMFDVNRGVFHE